MNYPNILLRLPNGKMVSLSQGSTGFSISGTRDEGTVEAYNFDRKDCEPVKWLDAERVVEWLQLQVEQAKHEGN